jgi:large subunit ribosomal protein L6
MSRIGKNPVSIPSGVTVDLDGPTIRAKGKLGEQSLTLVDEVTAAVDGDRIWIKPVDDSKRARTMWGMQRSLLSNLLVGVSEGFKIDLRIVGVGYRAAVQGKSLNLVLGFSHDVSYPIPEGIDIRCENPTSIAVSGIDRQSVGQVAAEIRAFRPPEPYKGKGVKYAQETIHRKEGKKK